MRPNPWLLLARLFFGALLLFEVLNSLGLLHFTLSFTWLGLILTLLASWGFLEAVNMYGEKWSKRPLATWVFWLAFAVVSIDAGGDIFHWYQNFSWYDQVVHFIGGMAVGTLTSHLIRRSEAIRKIHLPDFFFIASAQGIAMALGTLYEIEEYLEDFFNGSKRLGDGFDTANDLLLDALGSLIVVLGFWWLRRSRRTRKK